MVSFIRLLALFVPAVLAVQYQQMETALIESRDDYLKAGEPSPDASHEVVFAVKQKNLDKLEQLFWEVSDPTNAKYGQFLTRSQVADLTSDKEASSSVASFLRASGVKDVTVSPYGEFIKARAPIKTWEDLFATTFSTYAHNENRRKPINRALHYSLPTEIAGNVTTVFNTIQFPPRHADKMLFAKDTAQSGSVTPALINSYYHVTSNKGSSKASQSVYESLGQYFSPSDLSAFEKQYNIPQEAVATDIGGHSSDSQCTKDSNNCGEANLDVQYLIGISQVTPTTYWYDDSGDDSFVSWIQAVAATPNPPLVQSISYGAIESELPKNQADTFNTEAQKLGVQGVTITVSSGDDGVANFQARNNQRKCGYNPSFPATSPYVTAVGATQGPEDNKPEIACQSNENGVITTGGGFSTIFTAPSYQQNAVSSYFNSLSSSQQPASGYNKGGRGYPDVSSAGHNYEVVIGGKTYAVSGTSASSPVIAAFVSLVNAARLEAGKKPLGFINQAIYQNGAAISNDVTSGENNCTASKVCCTQGFFATAGWDPLTGFGSVDYQKFYNVFFNL